tara:strand:+ start:63 stop:185 length:123 start_codon:yes stop_codon:yes gene_type:complete
MSWKGASVIKQVGIGWLPLGKKIGVIKNTVPDFIPNSKKI